MENSYREMITKIRNLKAKDIPTQEITKIRNDANFRTILSTILNEENHFLAVIDYKDKHVGFITLLNILEIFKPEHTKIQSVLTRKHTMSDITAKNIAETHLPFIYDNDTLEHIAELMLKYGMQFLPRASDKKDSSYKGIIRLKDIFKTSLEFMAQYSKSKE
ncbi:MAG: CBS domain-containing protein [Candidatus Heimdallarchaeaceae archaeon]